VKKPDRIQLARQIIDRVKKEIQERIAAGKTILFMGA
jgi:hypothetical protein